MSHTSNETTSSTCIVLYNNPSLTQQEEAADYGEGTNIINSYTWQQLLDSLRKLPDHRELLRCKVLPELPCSTVTGPTAGCLQTGRIQATHLGGSGDAFCCCWLVCHNLLDGGMGSGAGSCRERTDSSFLTWW